MALHFDLNLFGQAFVVCTKNSKYFITAKVIRNIGPLGKGFPQLGTGQDNPIFLVVVTGPQGGIPSHL